MNKTLQLHRWGEGGLKIHAGYPGILIRAQKILGKRDFVPALASAGLHLKPHPKSHQGVSTTSRKFIVMSLVLFLVLPYHLPKPLIIRGWRRGESNPCPRNLSGTRPHA